MTWQHEWWWLAILFSAWLGLFIDSDPRRISVYYPGGLWSVALAAASEYIIRVPLSYWHTHPAIAALGGVEITLFIGPRLVEGILFYQLMPKQTSLQLPAVLMWAFFAVTTDGGAIITGHANWSWPLISAAYLLHALRFAALLGIFYGLNFERRAEVLGRTARKQAKQRRSMAFWKYSWIPLYIGARVVVNFMDKRCSKAVAKGDAKDFAK